MVLCHNSQLIGVGPQLGFGDRSHLVGVWCWVTHWGLILGGVLGHGLEFRTGSEFIDFVLCHSLGVWWWVRVGNLLVLGHQLGFGDELYLGFL